VVVIIARLIVGFCKKHALSPTLSRKRERGLIFYLPLPLAGEGWGEGALFAKPNNTA